MATNISIPPLEAWLPAIIPALNSYWADYLFTRSADQRLPSLGDWLALLRLADIAPEKIPEGLARLLKIEGSNPNQQNDWLILVDLFDLTYKACQASDHLTAVYGMLKLQHRVLQVSAELSQVRRVTPKTGILVRRALYLNTITELSKKFAAIQDLDILLDEVVTVTREDFGYDYVHLYLFNQAKQTLNLRSVAWQHRSPRSDDYITLKISQGIAGQVASTGQTVMANDVSMETNFLAHPALSGVKSQLTTPLLAANNLLGVLDVQSDHPNAFTEDDRQIICALADRVALAIENIQFQARLEQRTRLEKFLLEYDQVTDLDTNIETVLKQISRKITDVIKVGACVITLIDLNTQTISPVAEYVLRYPGNPPNSWRAPNETIPIRQDPIARQVLQSNRPVIQWATAEKLADQPWVVPHGYKSRQATWGVMLVLPLIARRYPLGMVEIYDKNKNRRFSQNDIQLCRVLARQVSLVTERAKLLQETHQRLSEISLLSTLAQQLPDQFDLQTTLDMTVQLVQQVMDCRGCAIYLREPNQPILQIKAAVGLKERWRAMKPIRFGDGPIGLAASERRTIYLPDTNKVSAFNAADKEVRSLLVTPLINRNDVIGTVVVDDRYPHAFVEEQQHVLNLMAGQISLAIQTVYLQTQLASEKQLTRLAIDYNNQGVLSINQYGDIVTCNQAVATLLGLDIAQIIGQNIDHNTLPHRLYQVTRPPNPELPYEEITLNNSQYPILRITTSIVEATGDQLRLIQAISPFSETVADELSDQIFQFETISIRTIINQVLLSLQGLAHQQNIALVSKLPTKLPNIRGDAHRIEQLLTHLIGNAIKHNSLAENVWVIASPYQNEVFIEVKEQETPLPPNQIKEIFESPSDSPLSSSGLFSYAQQIVEKHGGQFKIEMVTGQGIAYYFTLPIVNN